MKLPSTFGKTVTALLGGYGIPILGFEVQHNISTDEEIYHFFVMDGSAPQAHNVVIESANPQDTVEAVRKLLENTNV